eukprot:gene7128-9727_t
MSEIRVERKTSNNSFSLPTRKNSIESENGIDDSKSKTEEYLANLFPVASNLSYQLGSLKFTHQCSLEPRHTHGIIHFGNMYITEHFVLFYAKHFTVERKLQVCAHQIKSIAKEDRIVKHILLTTVNDKVYCLKNFWGDRDEVFDQIQALIDSHKDDKNSTNELNAKSSAEGEDTESEIGATNIDEAALAILGDESAACKLKHVAVTDYLPTNIPYLLTTFIEDNAPHGFKVYQESKNDTNVEESPWSTSEKSLARDVKFVKYVGLPGCSTTRGVKVQRLNKFGQQGFILYSSTRLADVPSADTFTVDEVYVFEAIPNEKKVKVELSCQVNFVKSTFMKSMIESSATAETKKWLVNYFESMKMTLSGPPTTPVASTKLPTSEKKDPIVESKLPSASTSQVEVKPVSNSPRSILSTSDLIGIGILLVLFFILLTLRSIDSHIANLQQ